MFKNLLVYLDPSDQGRRRLAAAAGLARDYDAHLTGLYVIPPDPVPPFAGGVPMGGTGALAEAVGANVLRERAEGAREVFETACEDAGVTGAWHRMEGPVAAVTGTCARYADLAILGQDPAEPGAGLLPPGVAAEVALDSGRPVLIIPHSGEWERIGTRPMVAWTATREASRGVRDALPFLKRAKQTTVVSIREPSSGRGEAAGPDPDLLSFLGRHGIDATFRLESTELEVADELLARMADESCDLLVMGAYGHSRLREFVFGGVTRSMLAHMTAPVLMSN